MELFIGIMLLWHFGGSFIFLLVLPAIFPLYEKKFLMIWIFVGLILVFLVKFLNEQERQKRSGNLSKREKVDS